MNRKEFHTTVIPGPLVLRIILGVLLYIITFSCILILGLIVGTTLKSPLVSYFSTIIALIVIGLMAKYQISVNKDDKIIIEGSNITVMQKPLLKRLQTYQCNLNKVSELNVWRLIHTGRNSGITYSLTFNFAEEQPVSISLKSAWGQKNVDEIVGYLKTNFPNLHITNTSSTPLNNQGVTETIQ